MTDFFEVTLASDDVKVLQAHTFENMEGIISKRVSRINYEEVSDSEEEVSMLDVMKEVSNEKNGGT